MLWGRVDSNHRTHPRTDLQSVAIAAMRLPLLTLTLISTVSRQRDLDPRPRDYKSRALPLSYAGFYFKELYLKKHTIPSFRNGVQNYNFFIY